MRTSIVALCFTMVLIGAKCAVAQNIYGFTSLDFDSSTNTLYAYSETDTDYDAVFDYNAAVYCVLWDDTDNVFVTSDSDVDVGGANGYASVLLEVSGNPGTEYSASGRHTAHAVYSGYDDYNRLIWYDPDYFVYFEGANVSADTEYDFFGPGPEATRRTQSINLGITHETKIQTTPNYQYNWECARRDSTSTPYYGTCRYSCIISNPGYVGGGLLTTALYRVQKACPNVSGCPYYLEIVTDASVWGEDINVAIVANSCKQ